MKLTAAAALALLAAASAPGAAQAAPAKVAIVVTGHQDPMAVAIAMSQAARLQAAGAQTQLVFMGQGVLALADLAGALTQEKLGKKLEGEKSKRPEDRRPLFYITRDYRRLSPGVRKRYEDVRAAGVQVLGCRRSASVLEVEDELAKSGATLAGSAGEFFDLAALVQQGYQVLTF